MPVSCAGVTRVREAATGSPRGLAQLCFWLAIVGSGIIDTTCYDVSDIYYMLCIHQIYVHTREI